ncbi:SRPBCC domain-containing protein [Algoriphagus sp. Y33]|uniref:SRPBCC domain-containing protein n=1 Tax=Algoriphagus sp. Y33 TaxID=2772483 RepID=UPI001CE1C702|nr:SRPBCC domain-containing protein [Algoriphagus sp. Y33]
MKTDFTTTLVVDKTPAEVFNAINNPLAWWSEEIKGRTAQLNDEFDYHFEDIHRCRVRIIELIPDQKVVWHVLDNYFKAGIFEDASHQSPEIEMAEDKTEWKDTRINFEISEVENKTYLRFTHFGLVPEYECFEVCSNGWTHYIRQSLFGLITTGKGEPNSSGKPMTSDEEKFHSTES